jgi:LmbE family N-acetylglucosaminyl deacetylase
MIKNYLNKILNYLAGKRSYKWVVQNFTKTTDIDEMLKSIRFNRIVNNVKILKLNSPVKGKRVLALTPHQDDETIGAGGFIIQGIRNGAHFKCVYLTDGGFSTKELNRDQMASIREKEAKKVWGFLGGEVDFLRFKDGGLPLNEQAANSVCEEINNYNPDIILIPFFLDNHIEHRRVNHLLSIAYKNVKNKNIEVWSYPVWSDLIPNVAVEITEIIEEKIALNRMWDSQNKIIDFGHFAMGISAANHRYMKVDYPSYWEMFFVVPLFEYHDLIQPYFSQSLEKIYPDYKVWIKIVKTNKSQN